MRKQASKQTNTRTHAHTRAHAHIFANPLADIKTKNIASIDKKIGDEGNRTLGDVIPDTGAVDIDQILDNELIRGRITKALSSLTKREELVLRMRFGISDICEDDTNIYEIETEE